MSDSISLEEFINIYEPRRNNKDEEVIKLHSFIQEVERTLNTLPKNWEGLCGVGFSPAIQMKQIQEAFEKLKRS